MIAPIYMSDQYKEYICKAAQEFVLSRNGLELSKEDIVWKRKRYVSGKYSSREILVKYKKQSDKRKRIDIGTLIVADLDTFVEQYYKKIVRDRKLAELGIL